MSSNQAFLDGLCSVAEANVKQGNVGVLNRIAVNPAVKHYYDNVFKLKAITYEQWERDYPQHVAMIDQLREDYDNAAAERARQDALEAKVEAMGNSLEEIKEALKALAKPAKPAKKTEDTEDAE